MHEESLVQEHIRNFNHGVSSGDFGPYLAGLTEDVVLRFEGVPVGPYEGRATIAAAYREMPPFDEVDVTSIGTEDGDIVVPFTWRHTPSAGGTMHIQEHDGLISNVLLQFPEGPM